MRCALRLFIGRVTYWHLEVARQWVVEATDVPRIHSQPIIRYAVAWPQRGYCREVPADTGAWVGPMTPSMGLK